MGPKQHVDTDKLTEMDDPIAFSHRATNNPDTMMMHGAVKQAEAGEFKQAIIKKIQDHSKCKQVNTIGSTKGRTHPYPACPGRKAYGKHPGGIR